LAAPSSFVLLVQFARHCPRAFAPGRFGQFHRSGRRTVAARPLKVAVLDQQKFVLADLIAARFVREIHCLTGDRGHELVSQAMTRAPVDLPE
jgi:hypothetical protein